VFAGKNENDPFGGGIPNAKLFLVQSLVTLSQAQPGKVRFDGFITYVYWLAGYLTD